MTKAKPFIKWVGGKSQLITQLEALLPPDFDRRNDVTYIEPFVGGGAMLFSMLQRHKNIRQAVINDINPDLTTCYKTVRDQPTELIRSLATIQEDYYKIEGYEAKKNTTCTSVTVSTRNRQTQLKTLHFSFFLTARASTDFTELTSLAASMFHMVDMKDL